MHNYTLPIGFDLASQKPDKTIDIGRDGVSLSTDPLGRALQFSIFHPEHGIAVAVPFSQFDGSKFYDPTYVRSYRALMLEAITNGTPGFGLDLDPDRKAQNVSILLSNVDTVTLDFAPVPDVDVHLEIKVKSGGELVQTATITNKGDAAATIPYLLNLGISLSRASYGQLTEGGPISLPKSENQLSLVNEHHFVITNPHLKAQLSGFLTCRDKRVSLSGLKEEVVYDAPLAARLDNQTVELQPQETTTLQARFKFSSGLDTVSTETVSNGLYLNGALKSAASTWVAQESVSTWILRRNVDYILGNCVVPLSPESVCIITDHVALPLGWNRDNYWQARLLLQTLQNIDTLVEPNARADYARQISTVAKGHIHWMFVEAKRPHGYWHRSYVVTGQPKDNETFQLDQQCYPLLALCDYLDHFPSEAAFVREMAENGTIGGILKVLESQRNADTGLWNTDETPGDDEVVYPHHFSSHVLVYRTFSRLHQLCKRLDSTCSFESVDALERLAREVRAKALAAFTTVHPQSGKKMFAYTTDSKGGVEFYHDANDVPTLFAPEWGFVSTPEEMKVWENTMAFGFTPLNERAYCAEEPYGTLGSVHSPGSWVLGLYQEMGFAALIGDEKAFKGAWVKIKAAMQWDGTFSEAVDPRTAVCTSKAWFSWPGAMIGALIIQLRRDGSAMARHLT